MSHLGTFWRMANDICLLTRILANWECELRWSCRWFDWCPAPQANSMVLNPWAPSGTLLAQWVSLSPAFVPWQRTSLNCHQDRAWTYQRWPDGAVTRCSLCGFWYPRMLEPCFPVVAELSGEEQRLFVIAVFNIIEVVLYRDNSISFNSTKVVKLF